MSDENVFQYSEQELAEGTVGQHWPDPIPLNQKPAVPAFPVSALPPVIADFATALAEDTQTPVDMSAAVALGTLAASVSGRATIKPKPSWTEPLGLYVVVAMDPGNMKSTVFRLTTAPLKEVERDLLEAARPIIAEAEAVKELKEGELARLKKSAINKPGPTSEAEYLQAAQEAAEATVPPLPRLIADDATPEAIASLAAAQGGRLAIASPEGGIFDIFAGRYSSGIPNLDVLLKGHAGDSITVDRKGRESEHIDSLTLTFILTVQPSVLRQIGQTPVEKSRGELERFLYVVPESFVGHRAIDPDPIPEHVLAAFNDRVQHLARRFADQDATTELTLSHEAVSQFREVRAKNEKRLQRDGVLGGVRVKGWGSKLSGAVARIAGILHLADGRPGTEVSADLIEAADQIGDYFTVHALAAFELMDSRGSNALAEDLLSVIRRHRLTEFSARDLMVKTSRSKFKKADDLAEPIETLVDHGWIIPRQTEERSGPGRPRSAKYLAHPLAFEPEKVREAVNPPREVKADDPATKSTQYTEPANAGHSVDSVDSVATSGEVKDAEEEQPKSPPRQWGVRPETAGPGPDLFGDTPPAKRPIHRIRILAYLAEHGPADVGAIAEATGEGRGATSSNLTRLKNDGEVEHPEERGPFNITEAGHLALAEATERKAS
ncbi:MAG: DUF3987 domain-containing protein [Brevibacterium sp.]